MTRSDPGYPQMHLAIDQGTHASRAIVFDDAGRVVRRASREVAIVRRGERVEQDARALLDSVRGSFGDVACGACANAGLAVQRSTVVAWDRETGLPLAPALSWQDTRARDRLAPLLPDANEVARRTGLRLSPHYGASKLAWLVAEVPDVAAAARAGRLALGPLSAWLAFQLIEGHPFVVDETNAARTLLYAHETGDFDPWLLERFGLERAWLPEVRAVDADWGGLIAAPLPLKAMIGDQNAALYGEGVPGAGEAVVNLGTGAFVLAPTGRERLHDARLLTTNLGAGMFALEGTVNGAGAALAWFGEREGESIDTQDIDAALSTVRALPLFLNTVGGLGSPWWVAGVAPRFVGEIPAHGRQERLAAVVESLVFLMAANLEAMREAGVPPTRLRASGGLARSDGLCMRLADLSGLPVTRMPEGEATARGVAWLAAGRPPWPSSPDRTFEPRQDAALAGRYRNFLDLVAETACRSPTA